MDPVLKLDSSKETSSTRKNLYDLPTGTDDVITQQPRFSSAINNDETIKITNDNQTKDSCCNSCVEATIKCCCECCTECMQSSAFPCCCFICCLTAESN